MFQPPDVPKGSRGCILQPQDPQKLWRGYMLSSRRPMPSLAGFLLGPSPADPAVNCKRFAHPAEARPEARCQRRGRRARKLTFGRKLGGKQGSIGRRVFRLALALARASGAWWRSSFAKKKKEPNGRLDLNPLNGKCHNFLGTPP